jgi:hypothetical protein
LAAAASLITTGPPWLRVLQDPGAARQRSPPWASGAGRLAAAAWLCLAPWGAARRRAGALRAVLLCSVAGTFGWDGPRGESACTIHSGVIVAVAATSEAQACGAATNITAGRPRRLAVAAGRPRVLGCGRLALHCLLAWGAGARDLPVPSTVLHSQAAFRTLGSLHTLICISCKVLSMHPLLVLTWEQTLSPAHARVPRGTYSLELLLNRALVRGV